MYHRVATSDAQQLRELLAAQPTPVCAELTPFEIVDADFATGFVRVAFAEQPAFRNHFGNIQGGFAVAMIDVLISLAAYVKSREWMPTIEIKSSFIAPAPIGKCTGEARVIRAGKTVVFLESSLWGADGQLAVKATATALRT